MGKGDYLGGSSIFRPRPLSEDEAHDAAFAMRSKGRKNGGENSKLRKYSTEPPAFLSPYTGEGFLAAALARIRSGEDCLGPTLIKRAELEKDPSKRVKRSGQSKRKRGANGTNPR
jgi:hypothetical protein